MTSIASVLTVLLLLASTVHAEIILPPGFTMKAYVTGEGFDTTERAGRGLPSSSTIAIDNTGVMYLARTGRRYSGGEVDDLWPVFRFPAGGARVVKSLEKPYLFGPPLPSAQVAALRNGRDLLVTTFDRDRNVGVLYFLNRGEAEMIAGGTPARGTPPTLMQPEGAAVDGAGNIYVADRGHQRIVKLDANGKLVERNIASVKRPRVLAMGTDGALWIAGDGTAEAPWSRGPGEVWRVAGDAAPKMILTGPVVAGMGAGPAGHVFIADRQAPEIFALSPEGARITFAKFTEGDAPRTLAFAPVTPETERAGIAGDLFVVTIVKGVWPVNEVFRISGPFGKFLREGGR